MKIHNEIDCSCAVQATLSEDGKKFSVRMTATAVYDEKTGARASAKIAVPKPFADAIEAAMLAALEAGQALVHAPVYDALSASRKTARALGEIK